MSVRQVEPRHRGLTRALVGFLATFCQIDPEEQQRILAYEEQRLAASGGQPRPGKRANTTKAPLWPRLVCGLYVFVNVHWWIRMYWQYVYDINYVRLQQSTERMANSTGWTTSSRHMVERYETSYNESRRVLAMLGQPWREFHWGVTFACALLMLVTLIVYFYYILLMQILKIYKPYNLYFIRVALSPEYEALKCRQLVRQCAWRLQDSSRNFVSNALARAEQCIQVVMSPVFGNPRAVALADARETKTGRVQSIGCASEVHAHLASHLFACDQLDQMYTSGELTPVNRSIAWLDKTSQQFATIALSNLAYSLIFDILTFCALPISLGVLQIASWADLFAFIEVWIFIEISVIATTCHMSLLNVNTTDQSNYMRWLVARVRRCVDENDHLFARCKLMEAQTHELALKAINRNLIQTIMEYEVFVAQFEPIRRTLSPVAFAMSLMTLGCPIITRLHMPYAATSQHSFGIYFCVIVATFADSVMWPICRLNTQSKLLHAHMMSLLSQMIEFNVALTAHQKLLRARRGCGGGGGCGSGGGGGCGGGQEISLCDKHLVWHLRRTLMNSNKFVEQFTADIVPRFMQLTLPNLIKLHYWYLLLILSYFSRVQSWSSFIGDLLDDPLGLLGSEAAV